MNIREKLYNECYGVFRSLIFMGFLTLTGTGFGAYIMAMAALSPCPLLVHSGSGTAVIVRLILFFASLISYVRILMQFEGTCRSVRWKQFIEL